MNWFALFPKVELLAHGCESSDNVVGELMQWAKQSKKNEGVLHSVPSFCK